LCRDLCRNPSIPARLACCRVRVTQVEVLTLELDLVINWAHFRKQPEQPRGQHHEPSSASANHLSDNVRRCYSRCSVLLCDFVPLMFDRLLTEGARKGPPWTAQGKMTEKRTAVICSLAQEQSRNYGPGQSRQFLESRVSVSLKLRVSLSGRCCTNRAANINNRIFLT
jgi:hypothetical protein